MEEWKFTDLSVCFAFVSSEASIINFAGSSKVKAVSFCFKEQCKRIVFASSFPFWMSRKNY